MNRRTQDIERKFDGKLIGSKKMQRLVAETLLRLPINIQSFVTKNVWFVSSFEDAWGFTLKIDELKKKGKYLLFLGDELWEQGKYVQAYEIAHEIGHVILKHRNAILTPQVGAETQKQEAEAHKFALKYLNK